jgi:hypothetical protein
VTMLHRSKIEHLWEELSHKIEDISIENTLLYEKIFPQFEIISPSQKVLIDLKNGILFKNTLWLRSWRKYLVKDDEKFVSIIEERGWDIRICSNNIE